PSQLYTLSLHDALPILGREANSPEVIPLNPAGHLVTGQPHHDPYQITVPLIGPYRPVPDHGRPVAFPVGLHDGVNGLTDTRSRADRKSTRLNSSHDQIS